MDASSRSYGQAHRAKASPLRHEIRASSFGGRADLKLGCLYVFSLAVVIGGVSTGGAAIRASDGEGQRLCGHARPLEVVANDDEPRCAERSGPRNSEVMRLGEAQSRDVSTFGWLLAGKDPGMKGEAAEYDF